MTTPHPAFSELTPFTAVEFEDVAEKYKLDEADGEPPEGYNLDVSDVFGEAPPTFLHKGAVTRATDCAIRVSGEYAGLYIIAGDLEVAGTLELEQIDGGSILVVSGSVRATNVILGQEAQLWIAKDLIVSNLILTDLSDTGGLAVKGKIDAKALVAWNRGGICSGKKLKARVIEREAGTLDEDAFPKAVPANEGLREAFTEDTEFAALVAQCKAGATLLR